MTVGLNAKTPNDTSMVLYLLRADGSVDVVDAVRSYRRISDPAFLRAKPGGTVRMYWTRTAEAPDKMRDAFWGEVVTRTLNGRKPEVVHTRLRFGETITDVRGYPGGIAKTVAALKVDADPDPIEVLSVTDGRLDTPTMWTRFAHRATTASSLSVAWLSPADYVVVKQASEDTAGRLTIEHFIVTCESPEGLLAIADGENIDDGSSNVTWNVLPVSGDLVYVLTTADTKGAAEQPRPHIKWSALSIGSGAVQATVVEWGEGPWTAVWADLPPVGASNCRAFRDNPSRVQRI